MSEWKPKPGTGWHRRVRDDRVHYGLMLEPGNEDGPCLFLTLLDDDVFEIGYSNESFEYQCPLPQHIQRIELDFEVPAWAVKGVIRNPGRVALQLQAVRVK